MKKILLVIITALLLLPTTVKAQEKVKVYIFEAGGCPYCAHAHLPFRIIPLSFL